ncbi:uncharacterized protein LOC127263122 [Andrographis paniculata]|uniref:uncharacterized protein LOC127263122 n=1 Tax=Andrographis paniculata TaxID=175694 RepID=UPI0021E99546|nr:uncharacterized protein LOC127263122 [Andrographis paniculata]
MLLRSSSTPILNPWKPSSVTGSGSSPETISPITRTRLFCPTMAADVTSPEVNSPASSKKSLWPPATINYKETKDGGPAGGSIFLSSSGLGGGGAGGSGWTCGDGRSSDGDPVSCTEAYYETMIKANPGNPLLLSNYAKFLKEVKGELRKAEEVCGRAILADPMDVNYMMSVYADLLWQIYGDAKRADEYFDRAVRTHPDDCYVLASYARFLWDVEDEDDNEEGYDSTRQLCEMSSENSYSKLHQEMCLRRPPLAAAS